MFSNLKKIINLQLTICFSARKEKKIKFDMEGPSYNNLINSINDIDCSNRQILNYCWINFPLAYTQLATFSVFLYFMAALFGNNLY